MLLEEILYEQIGKIFRIIHRRCHAETDMFVGASLDLRDGDS